MHGVRNFPWIPILFALPSKISNLRMREREILRRKGSMKSHIQTYAGYSSSAWCYSLWPCLFFFLLSISLLCVCTCSLFVYLPSFFCVCSPIYRGIEKQFSPFFAPNWSIHGAVWVSFSSTIPNFMVSRAPLFALFR